MKGDLRQFVDVFLDREDIQDGIRSRIALNVPKGTLSLRYSLETCFYDRFIYYLLGFQICKAFDKLLSVRVFNHRVIRDINKKNKDKIFVSPIRQWHKYEEFVKLGMDGRCLLRTDLQNYYENINIEKLKEKLLKCLEASKSKGFKGYCLKKSIIMLCDCLEKWSYDGVIGLPQNRDVSSFLANIYMSDVDYCMVNSGYDYYRYMDDICILCEDKYQARSVMKKLIVQLRQDGLTINNSKTSILESGTKGHNEFIDSTSLLTERIDSLINSRKKPVVSIGFNMVRDFIIELIRDKKYESREFRFCIGRISRIALCKDIYKPEEFFEPIIDGIVGSLGEIPNASDQFFKYLMAVETEKATLDKIRDFLLNKTKSIYG